MKVSKVAMRQRLTLGCAGIAIAVGAIASLPAAAQTPPATQLEEIIVTANKRSENQQNVPASVAAIGGEALESISAAGVDIRFLSTRIPSVYAESSFGRTFPRFYIRGLGNSDFDLNSTQPVGMVYDDVVQENPLLRGFPVFDLERVEVLRGPQGTLFGRNTPAGTISFISKKPTMETDGYVTASYGRWNAVDLEGAVGGALAPGVLAARISATYQRRDDYVDNTRNGEGDDLEGYDEKAGRLQLMYDAGGPLTVLGNVHIRELDGTARVFRANILTAGSNSLNGNFNRYEVSHDGQNEQTVDTWGASVKAEYDAGDLTVTSITGYESAEIFTRGDIDGGFGAVFLPVMGPGFIPFPAETADGIDDHYQFSQEFRLSSAGKGPLRWQTGLFYFKEDVSTQSFNYGNFVDPSGVNQFTDGDQVNTTWALFGQVNYDFTDKLTGTVGLRYTDDEKDFDVVRTVVPGAPPFIGAVGSTTGGAELSDDQITWDVSLSYAATDDVNLYARVANGYRAPSIQGRSLFAPTAQAGISVAGAETLLNYEVGAKSEFWDGRGRLNVTLFYSDIEDQQFTAVGGASNNNRLLNADKGEAYGFEAEFEALVTENLLVTSGLSYNHTEIKDANLLTAVCGGGCTVTDPTTVVGGVRLANLDGNPFPNAPAWIYSATARYGVPLASGELYFFTDWSYRSKVNFFLYESAEFNDDSKLEGGLKVGYVTGDGKYEGGVFVRNITNDKSLEGGIDFNNLTGFVNDPRTWGIEFTARF